VEHLEVIRIIPEIAITLTGFTGIVFALSHRKAEAWKREDWLKVYAMTAPPLTAFFCAFAPDVFSTLTSDSNTIWRLSNTTLGAIHLGNMLPFLTKMRTTPTTKGQRALLLTGIALVIAHFLAAGGYNPWLAFTFTIGLIQQLFVGIFNFFLLLKPSNEDSS
jgi:uncharacterized membrane protein SirB2